MKIGQSKPFMFALIMFIIATLSAGTLTVVNQVTAKEIAKQQAAKYNTYLTGAFSESNATVSEPKYSFAKGSVDKSFTVEGKGAGYLLTGKGGYSGDVTLFTVINTNGTINTNFVNKDTNNKEGIWLMSHSETSGKWQPVLEKVNELASLTPTSYTFFAGNESEGGYESVTDSTRTSTAVRNAFKALAYCIEDGAC